MNRLSLRNNRLKIHQDCRKITDHVRGIYGIYPNLIKENLRMPTFNRFDLQTLGSRPIIMPKNLPGHCQCWTECRGLCPGRTGGELQMNQLSSRNNRLKFQGFRRFTDHFRGIYGMYFIWRKHQNRKMLTCNQLDLESRGSWPTMPKNFPGIGHGILVSKKASMWAHPS